MENENYNEHPLDALLDDESEEEFGEPEIRDRFDPAADENVDGNLKNWTAQDFASIYVRFRPHLERHARRYLSNPVQAEEVVQDAFLYLMTSLPELDSELGVLKFLKWKIRLLSFDVMRASATKREVPVPEHVEFASEDQELIADLERAEDSAVIRLALAKLNPRQREALVASVYEEKSTEEVAGQLGLSENATRQLLFRARSSFKKALVGEAEIQGKSLGQVLTIAAKKAAYDAKENATKVGAFIVLVAVGIGILPSLIPSSETVVADAPSVEAPAPFESSPVDPPASSEESPEASEPAPVVVEEESQEETIEAESVEESTPVSTETVSAASSSSSFVAQNAFFVESEPFDPWTIDHLYEATAVRPSVVNYGSGLYSLVSDKGLWADFNFAPDSTRPLTGLRVGFIAESRNFFAEPSINDFYVVSGDGYETYVFIGQMDTVSDSRGNSWDNTRVDGSTVVIELVVSNETRKVINSQLSIN
jgi:RNA polymerase sigma-70 factor (ECF subfamily)